MILKYSIISNNKKYLFFIEMDKYFKIYPEYFEFLNTHKIIQNLKHKKEISIVLLNSRQLEYNINMLDDDQQKLTLMAYIVCDNDKKYQSKIINGQLIYKKNIGQFLRN
jgi:hypothetical protein